MLSFSAFNKLTVATESAFSLTTMNNSEATETRLVADGDFIEYSRMTIDLVFDLFDRNEQGEELRRFSSLIEFKARGAGGGRCRLYSLLSNDRVFTDRLSLPDDESESLLVDLA